MSDTLPLHLDGMIVFYNAITVVLQSMFYGMHLLLLPFGVHALMKRGIEARPNIYFVLAVFVPFLLSSAFWALQFGELLVQIQIYFLEPARQLAPNFTYYIQLFNAIIIINLLVSDVVVVWRAWVLCKDESRVLLLMPTFFLILTTLSIVSTIGLRFASYFTAAGPVAGHSVPLIKAIDYFQVSNLIWSFLTNFTATSVISFKAWRYRQLFKAGLRDAPNRSTQVEQVLTLLVESGFLYCISTVIHLICTVTKLPYGTVGDIYMPISTVFAGIYPTIVIVLVGLQRPMSNTLQQMTAKSVRTGTGAVRPTVSGQIQFSRHTPLYLGSVSEEGFDVNLEKGVSSLPSKSDVV